MATVTTLGFSIISRYSGGGVRQARNDLTALRAQLAATNADLQRHSNVLDGIPKRWQAIGGSVAAVAPALVPIAAQALATTGALTVMATSVGVALGAYGAAMKGAITRTMEMAKAGKALSPVQKEFVGSVNGMEKAWANFIKATTNQTLQPATHVVKGLTAGIALLKPLLDAVHPSVMNVAKAFEAWMKGDHAKQYSALIADLAGKSMPHLVTAGKAVLNVLGDGFRAFAPLVEGVAKRIAEGALALNKWSNDGGFQRFLQYVKDNGPAVDRFWKAFGEALANVMRILKDFSGGSLKLVTDGLRAIAAIDPSSLKAFANVFLLFRHPFLFLIVNCPILRNLIVGLLAAMNPQIIYAVAAAFVALRVAFMVMNTALLTTPLGLIIVGLVALGVAIVTIATKTTWFQTAWTYTWNFIKTVGLAVWNALQVAFHAFINAMVVAWTTVSGALTLAWNTVWNAMATAVRVIWTGLQTAWSAFTTALSVAWTTVSTALVLAWNTVWNAIGLAARTVWSGLTTAWNAFIMGLQLVWTTVSTALSIAWNAVWNAIGLAARTVWTGLTTAWNAFIMGLQLVWTTVSTALSVAWNAVWNAIGLAARTVWTGLTTAWNAFIQGLQIVWTTVSAALTVAWNAVWNALALAARTVWTGLQVAWNAFITGLQTIWTTVSAALTVAWNAVWNAISTAARTVWTALQVAWTAFVGALATAWTAVSAGLSAAWSAVWNAMRTAAQAVWTAMQVAWNAFITGLQTIWTTVSTALTAAWNAVWNALSTAARAIWTALQAAWQAFTQALVTAWTTIGAAISAAWTATWNAMRTAAQAVWTALQAAWNAFLTAVRTVWTTTAAALSAAWSATWNALKTAAEAIWNAMKAAWTAFTTFLRTTWDTFINAFKAAWQAGWDWISATAKRIWDWIGDQWRTLMQFVRTTWDNFINAFKAAWEAGWDWVSATAKRIWDWIGDQWKKLTSWINEVWGDAGAALKKAWESVWEWMKDTAAKIWNGIGGVIEKAINGILHIVRLLGNGFNKVAEFLHIDVRINTSAIDNVSFPKLANGGMVEFAYGGVAGMPKNLSHGGTIPGYAPGRDTIPAILSKGEGVLTPEAVRGLGGPSFVNSANRTYAGHRGAGSGPKFDTGRDNYKQFARGGMVGLPPGVRGKPCKGEGYADGGMVGGLIPFAVGGMTADALRKAGVSLGMVSQGEYSNGKLSAGTHAGGGVVDISSTSSAVVARLREAGFAAWARTGPAWAGNEHIHAVLMNHPALSGPAKAQVASFKAGGDGLGAGGGGGGSSAPSWLEPLIGKAGQIISNVAQGKDISSIVSGLFGGGGDNGEGEKRKSEGFFGTGIGPDVGPDWTPGNDLGDAVGKGVDLAKGYLGSALKMVIPGFGPLGKFLLGFIPDSAFEFGFKWASDLVKDFVPGAGGFGDMTVDMGSKLVKGAIKFLIGKNAEAAPEKQAMFASGGGKMGDPAAVKARWGSMAAQALAKAGLSASQLDRFLALMHAESGGNPGAANLWDSNAAKGQASRGLMQVIPSTFAAYRDKSLPNDILDPMANMVAAARYIKAKYGGSVPGSPYAAGTPGATRGLHLVGEQGPELMNFAGGETITPAGETSSILAGGVGAGTFGASQSSIEASLKNRSFEEVTKSSKAMAIAVEGSWKKVVSDSTTGWNTLTPVLGEVTAKQGGEVPSAFLAMSTANTAAWTDINANSAMQWTALRDGTMLEANTMLSTTVPANAATMANANTAAWTDINANSATQWGLMRDSTMLEANTMLGTTVPANATTMAASSDTAWTSMATGSEAQWINMDSTAFTPFQGVMTEGVPGAANTMQTSVSAESDQMASNVRSAVDSASAPLGAFIGQMNTALSLSSQLSNASASSAGGGASSGYAGSKPGGVAGMTPEAAARLAGQSNDMLLAGGWKPAEDGSWIPPTGGGSTAEKAAAKSAGLYNDMLLAAGWEVLDDGSWKKFAIGTPGATRGIHLVGEQGPELMNFAGGETITPAKETASILTPPAVTPSTIPTDTTIQSPLMEQMASFAPAQQAEGWFGEVIAAAERMLTTVQTSWNGVVQTGTTAQPVITATTTAVGDQFGQQIPTNLEAMSTSAATNFSEMTLAAQTAMSAMTVATQTSWAAMTLAAQTNWTLQLTEVYIPAETHQGTTMPAMSLAMQVAHDLAWTTMNAHSLATWTLMRDMQYLEAETHMGVTMPAAALAMQTAHDLAWTTMNATSTEQWTAIRDNNIVPFETHMNATMPEAATAMATAVGEAFTTMVATITEQLDAAIAKIQEFIEATEAAIAAAEALKAAQAAAAASGGGGNPAPGMNGGADLQAALARAGNPQIFQGPYSNSVSASAGTHSGGGVVDVPISAFDAMIAAGFIGWKRQGGAWAGNEHAHMILPGAPDLSPQARWQVEDYNRGGSGLGIPGNLAIGTNNARAGWTWVGEEGPELMRMRGGESVMPHMQSMAFASGWGRGMAAMQDGPEFLSMASRPIALGREVERKESSGTTMIVEMPITVEGNMDQAAVDRLENEVLPKLRQYLVKGTGSN